MKKNNSRAWPILLSILIMGGVVIQNIWSKANDSEKFTLPSQHNLQTLLLLAPEEKRSDKKEKMGEWGTNGQVNLNTLTKLSIDLLGNWGQRPPPYISAQEKQYSISDTFGLLLNALRQYNQNQKLPADVELIHLIPPAQNIIIDHEFQIPSQEILSMVNFFELNTKEGIPSMISNGSTTLSSAQWLHGMAQVYLFLQINGEIPQWIYMPPTENFK